MNNILESFARQWLRRNIVKCTKEQQHRFKLMYSHDDMDRTINEMVEYMDVEKLDWAMQQTERTLVINIKNFNE